MRVILSGGGTGGHIFPAIAIAQALKAQNKECEILFVGAKEKMEMKKVPEAGFPIIGLWIDGYHRKQFLRNITLPFKVIASLWRAKQTIDFFQPDIVIGTGGYASGPIVYLASLLKIPTLIQEQNALAGYTNKLLGRYVDKVCVAYDNMEQYFPAEKVVLTGNPVRGNLLETKHKKKDVLTTYLLQPNKKCLLVLGGTLGAKTMNDSTWKALNAWNEAGIQVIWQTGKAYYEEISQKLESSSFDNVQAFPFLDDIDKAYAAADLVVARAGALTIAELSVLGKPTIFVPSPNVAEDHQTKNVEALVAKDAAMLIKDSEASQRIENEVLTLMKDTTRRSTLGKNLLSMARTDAIEAIVGEINKLFEDH